MKDSATLNVRMRRVCVELIRLRHEAKLTARQAAQQLGVDASTVSRLETGRRGLNRDDVNALLVIYRAPRTLRNALLKLFDLADQPGLLSQGDLRLHDDLAEWIGFEATASGIRNYEPLLIPGLLQTFPYARAVIAGSGMPFSEEEISDRVNARIERQRLLRRHNRPEFDVILHEAALRQDIGGREVMRGQLESLVEVTERRDLDVRVVPMQAGAHPGLDNGPFVILNYANLPSLVHLENKVSSLYLESEEAIRAYKLTFDGLRAVAYSREKSLTLISRIASDLR